MHDSQANPTVASSGQVSLKRKTNTLIKLQWEKTKRCYDTLTKRRLRYSQILQTKRMIDSNTYLSIRTSNIIGLNLPTKKYRISEWIRKPNLAYHCLQEIHLTPQGQD